MVLAKVGNVIIVLHFFKFTVLIQYVNDTQFMDSKEYWRMFVP